jgi:uncharacterized protein
MFAYLLQGLDFHLSGSRELALVAPPHAGEPAAALASLARTARADFRPRLVIAGGREGTERPELMLERQAVEGRPTAYLCENFSCRLPVTDPNELRRQLDGDD